MLKTRYVVVTEQDFVHLYKAIGSHHLSSLSGGTYPTSNGCVEGSIYRLRNDAYIKVTHYEAEWN